MLSSVRNHLSSTADKSEILHILTMTYVTLVKIKGHMTFTLSSPLDASVILWNNPPDIDSYRLSMGANAKYRFSSPETLKMY